MNSAATTAVVMARGLGTRMRLDVAGAALNEPQRTTATLGLKSMVPDRHGRPFLDHILSGLADGGVTTVILVVAPDHEIIRAHYTNTPPVRVTLHFAVQEDAHGTADALMAARPLLGDKPFLVCNADNLYPTLAIKALVELNSPGVAAFEREALIRDSNIEPERVAAFASLTIDGHGNLVSIVEKPDAADGVGQWIGMNLWRFDSRIFSACQSVPNSSRGEKELPQAVALAIATGMTIHAVKVSAGVLDLSSRGDIAAVTATLDSREIAP